MSVQRTTKRSEINEYLNEQEQQNNCCKCNTTPGTKKLHICPYDEDINEDRTEKCNCCKECEYECSRDI